jgi:hypothetical protein
VLRLDDAEPGALADLSADVLHGYALDLADEAEREAGRVPARYTNAATCELCGPVWLRNQKNRVCTAQPPTVAAK